ncbi:MAG: hypothetical protein KAU95_01030 [Candidatus Aenigmarchaeota archaeon]|nr:hypothetical protein [Candidatus Aenigmarchaeota archaeon]
MKRKYFLFLIIFSLTANCIFATEVTTFVSPDCSYEILKDFISGAETSLYIAVYEFTNPCILDLLLEKNNLQIILLIDDSPVGGLKLEEKKILCELEKNNISTFLYKESGFHHAKYVVRDNSSVLVASENFGYTGFSENPTYGNRGWGAIVEKDNATGEFLKTFFEDLKNSEKFKCGLEDYEIYCNSKEGNYTQKFKSEKFSNQKVYSIFAPNAIDEILDLIDSANKSIYIQQMYIYKYWGSRKTGSVEETPNLFLESAIDKSRNGLDVKILLDSYWYNIDRKNPVSNYHTVEYINKIALEENLNLEAKLVKLEELGIEKIHNKGMIIDNKTVLVSSINWNEHSPKNNREAGIVISGNAAEYYAEVFSSDWEGIKCSIQDEEQINYNEDNLNQNEIKNNYKNIENLKINDFLFAGFFVFFLALVCFRFFKQPH